ncbi:uncharacterized protein LOC135144529 [Zophobas morio]|uniref:uncharacterized protein LOC135144529 n=1 Tax=Zophobas morio TaxID=2755281 RepID=UPI0030831F7F
MVERNRDYIRAASAASIDQPVNPPFEKLNYESTVNNNELRPTFADNSFLNSKPVSFFGSSQNISSFCENTNMTDTKKNIVSTVPESLKPTDSAKLLFPSTVNATPFSNINPKPSFPVFGFPSKKDEDLLKSKFYSLNSAISNIFKKYHETGKIYDFTKSFEDYIQHAKVIRAEKISSTDSLTTNPKNSFSVDSSLFGSSASTAFSFSNPSSATFGSLSSSDPKTFGNVLSSVPEEEPIENPEQLKPVISEELIIKGEENEKNLFTAKCKLFVLLIEAGKARWEEIGLGNLRFNEFIGGPYKDKRRIYFRTFTMQKVIFSSFITQTLDPKKEKSKSVTCAL